MNRVKNCTKDIFKALKIILIIPIVLITILYITCKPAYKVSIAGETIGFVMNKEILEEQINDYINSTDENIVSRQIDALPEYEFQLVSKNIETDENKIMSIIEKNTSTTYKAYAVNFNGEPKTIIANQDEANNLVNEVTADLNENIELNFDIVEVYTDKPSISSQEDAKKSLNEIKVEKITEYENKKAEEERIAKQEAERKAKEALAAKKAQEQAKQIQNTAINPNTWCLEIPKIGLKGNIANGTSAGVLNQFIGHFDETPRDSGNVGLAAHNNGHAVNYFANIKNLEANDVIYYTSNGVKKTYVVVSKDIIDVYDWSKLSATGDERVTLITCIDGNTEIRLCVQAVRVN